ncbi:MAG: hypothetical protein GWM92_01505 [Gemmatimonadetes bacterium]|nr:hypothetical protein [Gemmatimonadota bacterium]NIU34553.1 hypothetical protein [Gemmatimonadota bacterium]NIV59917.1 hypothetical protein [Gemmatimonadota bacterium]NIV81481.1 hypothetical protein [Gemmatimonadota bacterium]NIY38169.1 hypothetical protein [Gemmatimonadota bacterium]
MVAAGEEREGRHAPLPDLDHEESSVGARVLRLDVPVPGGDERVGHRLGWPLVALSLEEILLGAEGGGHQADRHGHER